MQRHRKFCLLLSQVQDISLFYFEVVFEYTIFYYLIAEEIKPNMAHGISQEKLVRCNVMLQIEQTSKLFVRLNCSKIRLKNIIQLVSYIYG